MRIVQNFGGSSLADWNCLRRAAGLSVEAWRRGCRPVVVVSAAGDSTDEMIQLAQKICPHPSPREMDALLATGEQRSAALMAIMLNALGAPSRSFSGWQAGLITEETHGSARIVRCDPERLVQSLARGEIPVVAGFQGVTPQGEISTLGRGGSDTTAVALAAALQAERCEIYTDVDGIYTADPRLIPEARLLPLLDRRDMLCLAEAGSQVLHAESVRLALQHGQNIQLLSSFTASPGTTVCLLSDTERPAVAGVTRDRETHRVTLVGRNAPALADILREKVLRPALIAVKETLASENSATFRVEAGQELEALRLIHRALWEQ